MSGTDVQGLAKGLSSIVFSGQSQMRDAFKNKPCRLIRKCFLELNGGTQSAIVLLLLNVAKNDSDSRSFGLRVLLDFWIDLGGFQQIRRTLFRMTGGNPGQTQSCPKRAIVR